MSDEPYIFVMLIALSICVIIRLLIGEPCYIPSGSMEPTLCVGDWVWVDKASYGALLPTRFSDVPLVNVFTWIQPRMFNPYSVMRAIDDEEYRSYWTTTGAYDSVVTYIQMNFDGLKDDIIRMLSGEPVPVTTTTFQNDMHMVNSRNDVLTVLIHLGYLSYDRDTNKCYIPNKEVADEMNNAVNATAWTQLAKALENSQNLLEATLSGDEQAVAQGIDLAHDEHTSILAYNDEN